MSNAADPRSIRKAKQSEKRRHDRDRKDLRDVLSTVQGRRFVWKQLEQAGVFRLSIAFGEPQRTDFNEGRRSLGLALMAEIHAFDPALYVQMAHEANEEQHIEALKNEDPKATTDPLTEDDDARTDTDPYA